MKSDLDEKNPGHSSGGEGTNVCLNKYDQLLDLNYYFKYFFYSFVDNPEQGFKMATNHRLYR